MCGRGRAGVRQERTAQYGGRMFVFATTQGVQGDMPSAMRLDAGPPRKIQKSARTVHTVSKPTAIQTLLESGPFIGGCGAHKIS